MTTSAWWPGQEHAPCQRRYGFENPHIHPVLERFGIARASPGESAAARAV